jgi:hypothetical protein
MTSWIQEQITDYQSWRDSLAQALGDYHDYLDEVRGADAQESLRIYDLSESLKHDRLTLAFVAEFSRGKTELINALFFADFKQRLLPSDVGRTTMCPTEIFFDPDDEPYIRLLPIESRLRDDSIAALKRMPVEWSKISLDMNSPEKMMNAMRALSESKLVSIDDAKKLGLWDEANPALQDMKREDDKIEIPVWRHALINYPHPLLKSGLSILDTPGLNTLGSEPELTFSMIPNSHAALFCWPWIPE